KRAYCLKTQPATGETYPKSDLFNKAPRNVQLPVGSVLVIRTRSAPWFKLFAEHAVNAILNNTIALFFMSLFYPFEIK
ncbi:hypothetical protein ABR37_18640, partial [Enterobacter hormaechei subsp. hoffmannii]|uniref:hypothetical protein n=1 Tax=Enterobacter hormaechei TaxID=158836 RepID=UPI0006433477